MTFFQVVIVFCCGFLAGIAISRVAALRELARQERELAEWKTAFPGRCPVCSYERFLRRVVGIRVRPLRHRCIERPYDG